jgi:hypothetical protein
MSALFPHRPSIAAPPPPGPPADDAVVEPAHRVDVPLDVFARIPDDFRPEANAPLGRPPTREELDAWSAESGSMHALEFFYGEAAADEPSATSAAHSYDVWHADATYERRTSAARSLLGAARFASVADLAGRLRGRRALVWAASEAAAAAVLADEELAAAARDGAIAASSPGPSAPTPMLRAFERAAPPGAVGAIVVPAHPGAAQTAWLSLSALAHALRHLERDGALLVELRPVELCRSDPRPDAPPALPWLPQFAWLASTFFRQLSLESGDVGESTWLCWRGFAPPDRAAPRHWSHAWRAYTLQALDRLVECRLPPAAPARLRELPPAGRAAAGAWREPECLLPSRAPAAGPAAWAAWRAATAAWAARSRRSGALAWRAAFAELDRASGGAPWPAAGPRAAPAVPAGPFAALRAAAEREAPRAAEALAEHEAVRLDAPLCQSSATTWCLAPLGRASANPPPAAWVQADATRAMRVAASPAVLWTAVLATDNGGERARCLACPVPGALGPGMAAETPPRASEARADDAAGDAAMELGPAAAGDAVFANRVMLALFPRRGPALICSPAQTAALTVGRRLAEPLCCVQPGTRYADLSGRTEPHWHVTSIAKDTTELMLVLHARTC